MGLDGGQICPQQSMGINDLLKEVIVPQAKGAAAWIGASAEARRSIRMKFKAGKRQKKRVHP